MIVDAKDYLDNLHLSIICQIQPTNAAEYIQVNFLPYPKGNRDEWISQEEVKEKIFGAFSKSDSVKNRDQESLNKALRGLREYYDNKFNKQADKIDPKDKQKGGAQANAKGNQAKGAQVNQKKEEVKSKQANDKQDKSQPVA